MHCVDSLMELICVVDSVISKLNLSDGRDQIVSDDGDKALKQAVYSSVVR